MEILRPPSDARERPAAPRCSDETVRLALEAERRQAEFLAGMSDELRAPLNSVLLLAKLLADNEARNLTAAQIDYAQTIYAAATDLLSLIDDILDLARIEAEGAAPEFSELAFAELRAWLLRAFRQTLRDKRVDFDVVLAAGLPAAMRTDGGRLRHILKNLLSLALKSARGGRLTLGVAAADGRAAFEVRYRAEGGIDCRHAVNLGLSICRQLAHSLGGDVRLAGPDGDELRCVLDLPMAPAGPPAEAPALGREAAVAESARRRHRGADEAVMLIAEGNVQVASVMLDLVRANGYQGVVASDLGTLRVLLRDVEPEAVLIGGSLLDVDGWSAFELLRRDPQTRRVPISVSCFEMRRYLCLQIDIRCGWDDGAERLLARLDAAAGRKASRLLLAGVPDGALAVGSGREATRVASAADAIGALRRARFDALVVGPALADMGVVELVREVGRADALTDNLAVALIEDAAIGTLEIGMLRKRARLEDMLGETALYLGRSLGRRGDAAAGCGRDAAPELAGRKALIVDDDIYSVYAMTGALERQRMSVILAENARDALTALHDHPDVAVALIDITMPELDGDGIIHALRATHEGALPIVAVTARAMPGDREKCIAAGASDYLAKPVNVAQMVALLRAWLGRAP